MFERIRHWFRIRFARRTYLVSTYVDRYHKMVALWFGRYGLIVRGPVRYRSGRKVGPSILLVGDDLRLDVLHDLWDRVSWEGAAWDSVATFSHSISKLGYTITHVSADDRYGVAEMVVRRGNVGPCERIKLDRIDQLWYVGPTPGTWSHLVYLWNKPARM